MSEIDDNYCGVVITYYDYAETKLKEEYFINAGKKEGIYKLYWENGKLFSEVNYTFLPREFVKQIPTLTGNIIYFL